MTLLLSDYALKIEVENKHEREAVVAQGISVLACRLAAE